MELLSVGLNDQIVTQQSEVGTSVGLGGVAVLFGGGVFVGGIRVDGIRVSVGRITVFGVQVDAGRGVEVGVRVCIRSGVKFRVGSTEVLLLSVEVGIEIDVAVLMGLGVEEIVLASAVCVAAIISSTAAASPVQPLDTIVSITPNSPQRAKIIAPINPITAAAMVCSERKDLMLANKIYISLIKCGKNESSLTIFNHTSPQSPP